MSRFLTLLLLVLLLPLQMSWAAARICSDHTVTSSAIEAGHKHVTTGVGDSNGSADAGAADVSCGAADCCHGLHHLMGNDAALVCASPGGQAPSVSGLVSAFADCYSRVERPKWPAA